MLTANQQDILLRQGGNLTRHREQRVMMMVLLPEGVMHDPIYSPSWALRCNISAERLLLVLLGHCSTERTTG